MPDLPDEPAGQPPDHPVGGREYPEGERAPGGYQYPEPPPTADAGPVAEPDGETEPRPVAAERFRRETRARRKAIPPMRGRHPWRLATVTLLYVMAIGAWADNIEPVTRASAHLLFWAGIGLAALLTFQRERRNGWEPSARWPWPAAAVTGTIVAELLIAAVGPTAITVGSVVVLGVLLFLVLLFG